MTDTELGKAQIPIRATMDKLDGDLAEANKKIEKGLGGSLAAIGNKIAGIGKAVVIGGVTAVAAAVTAIGVAAYKSGEALDAAYDKIVIGTGATGATLEGLKADFNAVFKTTPGDADTLAGAITALNAKLGVSGQVMQDLARPLVEVSRLMKGDAAANAEALASAMAAWGVPADKGAALLDKLFVASQKSGIGLEEIMASVKQFAPALKTMGLGLDESIALFAQMEKAGINGEQVMVALRTASGKFAKEGIPMNKGLADTIAAIQGAKDQTKALQIGFEVFGARAAPTMVDAIRSGKLNLEEMTKALADSEGAILKTAAATEDWPEKWAKLKNKATVALAPIGLKLMDIAAVIMDKAGPALEKLVGWFDAKLLPVIDNVVLAIQTMLAGDWDAPWDELFPPAVADVIKGIVATVQDLWPTLTAIFEFLGANAVPIMAGIGAVILATVVPAFWAWATASIAVMVANLPLIALIAAIGAAVGLLVAAWMNDWGGIRTFLTDFWNNTAKPIFEAISQWLTVAIPTAIATVSGFWTGTLVPAMQAVWGFIQEKVLPALASVGEWLSGGMTKASETMSNVWNKTLLPALQAVWGFVESYILPIFKGLVDVYIAGLKVELALLSAVWEQVLLPALQKAWAFIQDQVIPALKSLVEQGLKLVSAATDALATLWQETLWPAIQAVIGFIEDKVMPVLDEVGRVVTWLADTVFGNLKIAIDGIKAVLNWFVQRLEDLKKIIENIKLPDWLTPGSPTPFEMGIRGINNALREMQGLWTEMTRQPVLLGTVGQQQLTGLSETGSAQTSITNWYLTANYRREESESSLHDTVQMLRMAE